jgi:hypothetical protein
VCRRDAGGVVLGVVLVLVLVLVLDLVAVLRVRLAFRN